MRKTAQIKAPGGRSLAYKAGISHSFLGRWFPCSPSFDHKQLNGHCLPPSTGICCLWPRHGAGQLRHESEIGDIGRGYWMLFRARRRTQCRTSSYSGTAVGRVLKTLISPRRFNTRTAFCTAVLDSPVLSDSSCRLNATLLCSSRYSAVQRTT